MNDEVVHYHMTNFIETQRRYRLQRRDPISTLRARITRERDMVDIGTRLYNWRLNERGYASEAERQEDIDYITEHRLALICANIEYGQVMRHELEKEHDWQEERAIALGALRSL